MIKIVFGAVLGAVIVVAVVLFLGGTRISLAPTSTVAKPVASLPPVVGKQVDAVQQAISTAKAVGKPQPVTITVSEKDLTAAAAAYFPVTYGGASLVDPVIRVSNGQLDLDATAAVSIITTTAHVVAIPSVVAGRPSVRIDSATLGGQSVPDAVRQALAADIASAISASVPASLVVSTITAAQGTLTVQGTANP